MLRLPLAFVLVAASCLALGCNRGTSEGRLSGNGPVGTEAVGGDEALLQGTWEIVRMASEGKDLPPEAVAYDTTVTFEGNRMITKTGEKVRATWTYTLDSVANPKRMGINTAKPGEKERLSFTIYKIEGDTLTTVDCGRNDPGDFTAPTKKGCYLTVRRRTSGTLEDKLQLKLVSLTPSGENQVSVKFKVANTAGWTVASAKAAIMVLDAQGAEIGSESHYVVKSGAKLAPGAAEETQFRITVTDSKKAASVRFKVESVRSH